MHRPRLSRFKAAVIGVFVLALCLFLAGGTTSPMFSSPAFLISGMNEIPSPPEGSSWAPAPIDANGLKVLASTDGQKFVLHTTAGERTFLPGVDLGDSTPGHAPGEFSVSTAQYRAWFAAMAWLGLRVVRVYTIHPPAFYQQLAAYDKANPDRPLYLMQGVENHSEKNLYDPATTSAFQKELRDASGAVSGDLTRTAAPGRAGGTWDTDVTPWLIGWVIGSEIDPVAGAASDKRNDDAPAVSGQYFRSTPDATPTERWLAARMQELAALEAKRGVSQPIAFVNSATTDPLRHPDEPVATDDLLQLDADHVRPTANWPAGTFASYHAYPFSPDFQRHEAALQQFRYDGKADPYAGYISALRRHHTDMPTLITEFGVPSSIGAAHNGPLGRNEGDHSEQDAMRSDAGMLRVIKDEGASAGFLFEWADEWNRVSVSTIKHQDDTRRQLWHDPLTAGQWFGLLATDAQGQPGAAPQTLLDAGGAWPTRRVTAQVDESYVRLRVTLGGTPPDSLALSFDVLPGIVGTPFPGSTDRKPDAVLALNRIARTGQAYLRTALDPLKLDYAVPAADRGPAPSGWRPVELLLNPPLTIPSSKQKLPIELQNAGVLRYGTWDPAKSTSDSRALWYQDGDDLVVRVPWALLGFADPSSRAVAVPKSGKLTTALSPGIVISASASGSVQAIGELSWASWNRPYYAERLKEGAAAVRDAALAVAP